MSAQADDPSRKGRCTKRSKRTGLPCGGWGIKGTEPLICRMHGGAARQVKAKAAERVLQSDLQKALQRKMRQAVPVTDPLRALQEHAGEVKQWYEFLKEQIEELRHNSQWNTEQINGITELFARAMSEFRQTLKDTASLKIDERLIAIEEGKVAMMQKAMLAGLAAAGVTGPAAQNALTVMVRELRVAKPTPTAVREEIGVGAGY